MSKPYFHACPIDPGCPYCSGTPLPGGHFDWSFVDSVYCISLQERPDRTARAAMQFHRVGLCRHVRFYRPVRHATTPVIGIWESHRAVARDALDRNLSRTLILEDDVHFAIFTRPATIRSVARAMDRLPPDWWIFYLGHWPIECRFVGRNLLRTRSACTHAYVANRPLLDWLQDLDYERAEIDHRWRKWVGFGIDAAFAGLPGAYAFFPMIATQNASPSDHLRPGQRGAIRRLRHLVTRTWAREVLLSQLMRPNEIWVVLRSLLRGRGEFEC